MVTQSKFDFAMSSSPFDASIRLPQRYKTFSSKLQYQLIITTMQKLQECGFYWGAISGKQANEMLAKQHKGTFLLRDSSDNGHFFTLSVKTFSGPRNLRIQCDSGSFFFQTDPRCVQSPPRFDCVLKLIYFYMPVNLQPPAYSKNYSRNTYYIHSGREMIPLELLRPLTSSMSSLQHLCRKTVNSHQDISIKKDQLPTNLKEFLQMYDAPI